MSLPARAARAGLGFGAAVAGVELAFGIRMVMQNHMTPPLPFMVKAELLGVGLGLVLGVVLTPLLALRRGPLWHLLGLGAVWAALEQWVSAASVMFRVVALLGPVAGVMLVLLARRLGRRRPWLPPALATLGLVLPVVVPIVYVDWTAPPKPPRAALPPARPGAPDVVLVVLDTVRADHVSAYGYHRPTTPALDALAREGALFRDATSPATWSLPSHASLFTGLFASAHGAHDEHKALDPGPPTLGERLAAAGYDTRCFTANSWISDGLGLTRGFAWCDEAWREGDVARGFQFVYGLLDRLGFGVEDKGGSAVAGHFEDWVAARPADDRPAYAFLNFIEAHFPYHQLPDDYLRRFTTRSTAELRALSLRLMVAQFGAEAVDPAEAAEPATAMYDGGIAYADHLLGRVVEALRRRGSLDRTVLVVTADHGELLGEHGEFGHGHGLYEPELRVPLVVRHPPRVRAGTVVARPVSTVGAFATVLDLVGLEPTAPLHVSSLLPALAGESAGGPVLAEQYAAMLGSAPPGGVADPLLARETRFRAYRVASRKLIEASPGTPHLFDLARDPGETQDLAANEPAEVARRRAELETVRAGLGLPALDAPVGRGAAPVVDPAARERLRALGYVE
jgi:arylsulfatase A-like enzyme